MKPCSKPGTRSGENINLWPSDALPTIMVVRLHESLTLTPKGRWLTNLFIYLFIYLFTQFLSLS